MRKQRRRLAARLPYGYENVRTLDGRDLVSSRRIGKMLLLVSALHYANMPMQYTAIFHSCKNDNFQMKFFNIFLIFALKHRLWVHVRTTEAVLTSTHNLCFRAKIRT